MTYDQKSSADKKITNLSKKKNMKPKIQKSRLTFVVSDGKKMPLGY